MCEDIKSYKKIYYTAKEYYDYRIVTADDDFFYPSTWLEELDDVHKKNPNTIVCHRSHRIIELMAIWKNTESGIGIPME